MDRFGYYGQGDYKNKVWYIYDRKNKRLLTGYQFKTKKEVIEKITELNKKERR